MQQAAPAAVAAGRKRLQGLQWPQQQRQLHPRKQAQQQQGRALPWGSGCHHPPRSQRVELAQERKTTYINSVHSSQACGRRPPFLSRCLCLLSYVRSVGIPSAACPVLRARGGCTCALLLLLHLRHGCAPLTRVLHDQHWPGRDGIATQDVDPPPPPPPTPPQYLPVETFISLQTLRRLYRTTFPQRLGQRCRPMGGLRA